MGRPDWWPAWVPRTCGEGHDLDDGISLTWEWCDCPAAALTGGHQVVFCRVNGCASEPARPPGHVGAGREQR